MVVGRLQHLQLHQDELHCAALREQLCGRYNKGQKVYMGQGDSALRWAQGGGATQSMIGLRESARRMAPVQLWFSLEFLRNVPVRLCAGLHNKMGGLSPVREGLAVTSWIGARRRGGGVGTCSSAVCSVGLVDSMLSVCARICAQPMEYLSLRWCYCP